MGRILSTWFAGLLALGLMTAAAFAQEPPAPGQSPRIDAIRKAGVLRVGVQDNEPWLTENTTGQGEPWSGPAWVLAKKYADLLHVKLVTIPTSNETKVALLAANQADISITALNETPERLQVVDFVLYSLNSTCMIGLANNPKFAAAKTVDDLNSPDFTIVYGIGAPDGAYEQQRFPKATIRGVTSAQEEVISGHADSTPVNRVQIPALMRKVKNIIVLPKGNNCAESTEQSLPVGMAIDKNQPAFLAWLRAVADTMKPALAAEELRVMQTM